MTRESAAVQPARETAVGSRPASLDSAAVARWWGPVALYALALLVGASVPPTSIPGGVSDGLLHGWGYAGFTVVIVRAFDRGRWNHVAAAHALASMLAATAYGLAMEVYQTVVPGRFFDLRDLVANAVGAVTAAAIVVLASRARHSRR